MEDPDKTKNRRQTAGETKEAHLHRSGSVGSVESSKSDEPIPPVKSHALKRKFRIGRYTWYQHSLMGYFPAVAALGIIIISLTALTVGGRIQAEERWSDHLKMRKDEISQPTSFLSQVWSVFYRQNNSLIMAALDFLVLTICIRMLLSEYEQNLVKDVQMEISEIIEKVPRTELVKANHPARELIGEKNALLNRIIGNKHFKIKIMKLEFMKECLTLNYIIFGTAFALKTLIRPMKLPSFPQIELILDFCLMTFINYKNIVYVSHRFKERVELHKRRTLALFLYTLMLVVKAVAFVELAFYANSYTILLASVLLSFLVYKLADRINDFRLVNNIRIYLFLALYSK